MNYSNGVVAIFFTGLFAVSPLYASDVIEVGAFQVEFLNAGDSAIGGQYTQFGYPNTITSTVTWSDEQKQSVIRSLEVLNNAITNETARSIRVAMSLTDDLPENYLGQSRATALIDMSTGQARTTAEAAWRDAEAVDAFPEAADILIEYSTNYSWYFGEGLPGNKDDFSSTLIHEVFHGLGLATAYDPAVGFEALSRWDSLLEDHLGNRPQAGTWGVPDDLTVIGPMGTVLWRGEYANATYGGPMLITTFEDEYNASSLHHTGPAKELMSWSGYDGQVQRSPNKLLLDILRDLGWTIDMDLYQAFGPTYYRNADVIDSHEDFSTNHDYVYALYVNGDSNHISQIGALASHGERSDVFRLSGDDNIADITGSLMSTGDYSTALYVDGTQNRLFISGDLSAQGSGSAGIYVVGPLNKLVLSNAVLGGETAVYFGGRNGLYIQNGVKIDGNLVADGLRSVMRFGYLIDEDGAYIGVDTNFRFRFDDDISGLWAGYLGAGELTLNGDAAFTTLVVREPATLKGTATIQGAVDNQGRIAPGNSIGTLTIDGNYTHAESAVLEAEIGAEQADLLQVTGTADLQGGTLLLIPTGYLTDSQYTVLEAGRVQGSLDTVWSPAAFSAVLDTSHANSLTVDLSRNTYESLVSNSGQLSLARALDEMRPVATGAEAVMLNTLDGLALTQLQGVIDELNPRLYTALTTASLDATHKQGRMLFLRMDREQGTPEGPRLWVLPTHENARYDATATSPALRSSAKGIMLGTEQQLSPGLLLGFAAGYSDMDLDLDLDLLHSASRANRQSWDGYLYAHWQDSTAAAGWFAQAAVGLGRDMVESRRAITTLGVQADSEYDALHGLVSVNSGYRYPMGALELLPSAGLEYLWLREDGFTEQGGEGAALRVSERNSELVRSALGLQLEHSARHNEVALQTRLGAVWHHTLSSSVDPADAAFAASGTGFGSDARDPADNTLELNLMLDAEFGNNVDTWLGYQYAIQDDGGYRSDQFVLGVGWRF